MRMISPNAYNYFVARKSKEARRKTDKLNEKAIFGVRKDLQTPQCRIHNIYMKYHAKGHSKRTGKPYQAFFACPIKDRLGFCSQTISVKYLLAVGHRSK